MRYRPTCEEWEAKAPAALGLRAGGLRAAIAHHLAHESAWPRDFLTPSGRYIGVADEPPTANEVLGPVRARQGPNGLIVRGGYIAAEWGDTRRADMSFSVAKSYLAVLAGLAVARGRIRSIDDPVRDYALDDGFRSAQNHAITWRHLLTQTSEWRGTLWGKPDTIDHNRDVGKSELGAAQKGEPRPLRPPGTLWEYNDVRVNRLALSLLQVFRRPLPDVLREDLMSAIGATSHWEWWPYRNSWFDLDGVRLPSVPGGSHWGGGLWMGSRDHARFGLLVLGGGRWDGRDLVPEPWVREMRAPCALNSEYGLLWWLNTGRRQFPAAPESCFAAIGAGSNLIFVDPEHDLVAVVRWIDRSSVGGFIQLLIDSVAS
jgi:CubicO group peptidase (beta-lactamase class C family)